MIYKYWKIHCFYLSNIVSNYDISWTWTITSLQKAEAAKALVVRVGACVTASCTGSTEGVEPALCTWLLTSKGKKFQSGNFQRGIHRSLTYHLLSSTRYTLHSYCKRCSFHGRLCNGHLRGSCDKHEMSMTAHVHSLFFKWGLTIGLPVSLQIGHVNLPSPADSRRSASEKRGQEEQEASCKNKKGKRQAARTRPSKTEPVRPSLPLCFSPCFLPSPQARFPRVLPAPAACRGQSAVDVADVAEMLIL